MSFLDYFESEKPLEKPAVNGGLISIFRTVGCIGDSLSSGEMQVTNEEGKQAFHDLYEYSWGQFIARAAGITVYNFSKGGMTAKEYMESFALERDFFNPDKACRAYIIALGANDLKRMEIGSVEDIDLLHPENNKPTFAGYYGQIVSKYKEISPDAKFFFMSFPKDIRRGKLLEHLEFLTELSKIVKNSYVLDLYHYAPEYDRAFIQKYFLNGHMNPAGYALTAEMVMSYIDWIIRQNPEDFKRTALIGTGIKDYT